jgi:meso-butanediol dehydrogenase / (S,S)-butanediol dehydrogenase / diacetyl reductase
MPTALVTGAARGIGLATTRRFLDDGWTVAMVDRDEAPLNEAAGVLHGVAAIVADVSDPAGVAAMAAEAMARFGRIDALVNNAGVADFGAIGDTGFDRRVMETNLDGLFLVSQAVIPALKQSKGAIVNIASISGLRASTLRVAYGTSKAAVIQLTLQQAVELGEFGIRANCVAPGPVRTKLAMAVHSRNHRGLSRCDPVEPLWVRGRNCRGDPFPVFDPGVLCHRADHRGRWWLSGDGDRASCPAAITSGPIPG